MVEKKQDKKHWDDNVVGLLLTSLPVLCEQYISGVIATKGMLNFIKMASKLADDKEIYKKCDNLLMLSENYNSLFNNFFIDLIRVSPNLFCKFDFFNNMYLYFFKEKKNVSTEKGDKNE